MTNLHQLSNDSRGRKNVQRVGRGPGSKRGKTSCRGHKGQGSRSGARERLGYEGGRQPLHRKLPIRGFTRGRFLKKDKGLNLEQIEKMFSEGEVVNISTLEEKGIIPKNFKGKLRILGKGEISKKITIEASHYTQKAKEKLEEKKIECKVV